MVNKEGRSMLDIISPDKGEPRFFFDGKGGVGKTYNLSGHC